MKFNALQSYLVPELVKKNPDMMRWCDSLVHIDRKQGPNAVYQMLLKKITTGNEKMATLLFAIYQVMYQRDGNADGLGPFIQITGANEAMARWLFLIYKFYRAEGGTRAPDGQVIKTPEDKLAEMIQRLQQKNKALFLSEISAYEREAGYIDFFVPICAKIARFEHDDNESNKKFYDEQVTKGDKQLINKVLKLQALAVQERHTRYYFYKNYIRNCNKQLLDYLLSDHGKKNLTENFAIDDILFQGFQELSDSLTSNDALENIDFLQVIEQRRKNHKKLGQLLFKEETNRISYKKLLYFENELLKKLLADAKQVRDIDKIKYYEGRQFGVLYECLQIAIEESSVDENEKVDLRARLKKSHSAAWPEDSGFYPGKGFKTLLYFIQWIVSNKERYECAESNLEEKGTMNIAIFENVLAEIEQIQTPSYKKFIVDLNMLVFLSNMVDTTPKEEGMLSDIDKLLKALPEEEKAILESDLVVLQKATECVTNNQGNPRGFESLREGDVTSLKALYIKLYTLRRNYNSHLFFSRLTNNEALEAVNTLCGDIEEMAQALPSLQSMLDNALANKFLHVIIAGFRRVSEQYQRSWFAQLTQKTYQHHLEKKEKLQHDINIILNLSSLNGLKKEGHENMLHLLNTCGVCSDNPNIDRNIRGKIIVRRMIQDYVKASATWDEAKQKYISYHGHYANLLKTALEEYKPFMAKEERLLYFAAEIQHRLLSFVVYKTKAGDESREWAEQMMSRLITVANRLGDNIPDEKRQFYQSKTHYDYDDVRDDIVNALIKEELLLFFEKKTGLKNVVSGIMRDHKELFSEEQNERIKDVGDYRHHVGNDECKWIQASDNYKVAYFRRGHVESILTKPGF